MSKTGMFVAFALGAAAGGTAALLMAPDKGSETRNRIKEGTEHLVEGTKESVETKAHRVSSAARAQTNAVKEAAMTARKAYKEELAHSNSR